MALSTPSPPQTVSSSPAPGAVASAHGAKPIAPSMGFSKLSVARVRAILARGDTLFTSHNDNKIRVWSFNDFVIKKVCSIPRTASFMSFSLFSRAKHAERQHKECVSCMAYYHAEGILYTASYDRTVKVWLVSSRKCVDSFVAYEDKVNAILVNQENGYVFRRLEDLEKDQLRELPHSNDDTQIPTFSCEHCSFKLSVLIFFLFLFVFFVYFWFYISLLWLFSRDNKLLGKREKLLAGSTMDGCY